MSTTERHQPLPRKITRSRYACSYCRQRRIRCDVSSKGIPCTNCELDHCHCAVIPIRKPDQLFNRPSLPKCPEEILSTSGWVMFSAYSFLKAELQHLKSQDIILLQSKGILYLPAPRILEEFIHSYFLYVHPCMPVIGEPGFWKMYRGLAVTGRHLSLLLLQAMLFAASSFVSQRVIDMAGYGTVDMARNRLYRNAKMLYDMRVKDDPYSTAQAAILLSYRNTKGDQLANSAWLRVAIRYTRAAKDPHFIQIRAHEHRTSFELKILWWCCIVRDRVISIGVRRPLQMMDTAFDSELSCLSLKDIQHEFTSEVYDTEAKTLMCKIFISQCQLAAVLTVPATLLYGMNRGKEHQAFDLEKFQIAKKALENWRDNFMASEDATKSGVHQSVLLYFRLTLLYYHAAYLSLCHYIASMYTSCQMELRTKNDYPDLMDAVSQITGDVQAFLLDQTVDQLPVSAIAYTILPQILLKVGLRLPGDESITANCEHQLQFYTRINSRFASRFDMTYVSRYMQDILDHLELTISTCRGVEKRSLRGKEPLIIIQLTTALDSLLSTGGGQRPTLSFNQSEASRTDFNRLNILNPLNHSASWPASSEESGPSASNQSPLGNRTNSLCLTLGVNPSQCMIDEAPESGGSTERTLLSVLHMAGE